MLQNSGQEKLGSGIAYRAA